MKIKVKSLYHFLLISAVIGPALSYSKLYLFHIILIIFLLSYLYATNGKICKNKFPTYYHKFFIVMMIWYALTLIWSQCKIYTLIYLGYIVLGSILAISVIYYSKNLERLNNLAYVLSGIFCIDILVGLLEVLTKFRWPISPYSYYVNMFGRSICYDPNWSSSTLNYIFSLPTGFHWNPNNFATVMNILLPFFLFHPRKLIKVSGSVLIILLIIAASSRANIIASLFILSLYLIVYNKKRAIISLSVIIAIICVSSLAAFNFSKTTEIPVFNKQLISGPLDAFNALNIFLSEKQIKTTSSIGIRQLLITKGINAVKDSYGLGLGGGASRLLSVGNIESMHFFWLEIVVDAGIVFIILFFTWYAAIVVALYSICHICKNQQIRYYASASSLALIGFIPGAVSSSSTIYMLPMWILFGFSVATINVYAWHRSDNRSVVRQYGV